MPYREISTITLQAEIDQLKEQLAQLTQSIEVTSTVELQSSEAVPEITISHDQLASGKWRYKTSVTMRGAPEEVARALELADTLARSEANRRMAIEQSIVDQRITDAQS